MIIKAGSVTNLTDARFFAAYNVDYIGFCFDPQSPDYISPTQASAIKGWITGLQIVAEFAHQDADNIKAIVDFFQPDIVEFTPEDFQRNAGLPDDKKWNGTIFIRYDETANGIVDDSITMHIVPFALNHQFPAVKNRMLDVSAELELVIDPSVILAIQLKGGPEQEVGLKSFDRIAELLESLSA